MEVEGRIIVSLMWSSVGLASPPPNNFEGQHSGGSGYNGDWEKD